ncbi:SET domain-containing protein [Actinoplanes sp. M2I2]|uniref:SET domain-containing protein n=1 Tax=Actinoplanes sp. M2I2 TaxID=1734444 RepID=UPI002020BDCD|nr:SET domain-containing protein-lysine N-methyltransferase [Actinoplanes sp. M2I2]
MWPTPEPDCWLHPAVEVRPSAVDGDGLFARTPISRGATVSRLGGRLVSTGELTDLLDNSTGWVDTITVAEDVHLVLPPGRPNGKGNHSCDPNLWWGPPYTLIARRDLAAGEELTNDYATSTGVEAWRMSCRCGTRRCRGVVSGQDWKRLDLRQIYGDHWVPALRSRIRGLT